MGKTRIFSAGYIHKCSYCQVLVLKGITGDFREQSKSSLLENSQFLPRCMECRCGLAMIFLSVCPSICLSNACIVTEQKKNLSRFYTMQKIFQSSFLRRRMVGRGLPISVN